MICPDDDRPRLLLDVMLGKLATYLRMCGYDAAYALDRGVEDDDAVLDLAASESRVLLTRDRQLASRATESVLLAERDVEDQLRELHSGGFTLSLENGPKFCGRCNGRVDPVGDTGAVDADEPPPDYVPADTPLWQCRECGQYFWRGSHWDDVEARLNEL
ncbi:hypothetical protein SAMN04487948_102337 [Halogranum amylolyticum]|uniref:Mut7-C RNAse domain-containing protein n=1 Tax=Halogranum amylolyticum TaxID=660520 RepID=A0A1H8PJT8_9EURY|nr:Mut7-C RNAse domain-containing protein [Halogranum amylolyticum]SEO41958.1 hypothetical protein SAMN04487948_102337 [Halogranum amylolyticum]